MTSRVNGLTTLTWLTVTAALLCAGGGGCGRDDAAVKVDLTTPRSAATVFTRALEAGDAETAKTAAYGAGLEVEWVEAMAQAMSGMRQLMTATERKFGAESRRLVAANQTLQISATLADAEVQMNGDRATVIPSGGGEGMTIPLKRIDGNWKIDVGLLTRGEDISFVVKQLRVVGQIAPQLTKDVEAGKFATVGDIQRAMGRAVAETVYGRVPVTRPATIEAPADDPVQL